jgi:hypothetical protein
VEPVCERVEFRDVSTKFCIQNFQYFKNAFKTKLKNREHMLPDAKTPLPTVNLINIYEIHPF